MNYQKILTTKSLNHLLMTIALFFGFNANAQVPTSSAPAPTALSADVISLFSNAYTNVSVDTWLTGWSAAMLTDTTISGDDMKRYSNLDFAGVEATGANIIDASSMVNFNISVWTANATTFRVKLVDFGANASFGGGDDVEHEIAFMPTANAWNVYNIALTDFTGLTTKSHIAQIIFSALPTGTAEVYVDNIYFSKTENGPLTAAPTPTMPQVNVISMFSNAYNNVTVDTWRTGWSSAILADVQVAGNDVKRYSSLDFVGIETTGSNVIDITTMERFNFDVWTPNVTTLKVKIVDFGTDGNFGGGDDTEHELTFSPTANVWNTFNVNLADFTGLTGKAHIAQLIFAGQPTGSGTIYLDNIYYSKAPTSIQVSSIDESVSVYPNPANNQVKISAIGQIQQVEIFNSLGQSVYNAQPGTTETIIALDQLPTGVYSIVAIIDGVAKNFKLVIE